MCVCVRIYIRVCGNVITYSGMHTQTPTYTRTLKYIYTYIHTYIYVYIYIK